MRYQRYVRRRYLTITGYLGAMLMVIGGLLFVPLLVLPFYPEEADYSIDFIAVGAPLVVIGWLMWRRLRRSEGDPVSLTLQEGMVVVLLVWVLAGLVTAVPMMMAGQLTFTQSVFESVSGLTTTGLSVVNVEEAPHILLFYRSLLQFAGGAGFAIIALSALTGPAGAGLTAAEGRTEQLAPHVRQSAGIVLRIYLGYAVVGILALRLAGMDWFDAVNHAFTALATGGFSTRTESIGYYNNPAIEAVVIVLMLLGALNFLTAYTLFRGRLKAVAHNGEVRTQALILGIAIPAMLIITTAPLYTDTGVAVRTAIFETVSALTGTGFTSVTYVNWNAFGVFLIILLMTTGGGVGSTAGGLKLLRVYVMFKAIRWEFRRAFLPAHTVNEPSIWQGEDRSFLTDFVVRRVALYVFFYMVVLAIGTLIVAAHGYSLRDSLFEYASALGTVGLSVGVTAPDAAETLLWSQTVGMLLGRLEFFAVFIGIAKLVIDLRVIFGRPKPEHEPVDNPAVFRPVEMTQARLEREKTARETEDTRFEGL
ncbi:MAG: TrkH family potassium uptake protein [Chloroflexota bacterium]